MFQDLKMLCQPNVVPTLVGDKYHNIQSYMVPWIQRCFSFYSFLVFLTNSPTCRKIHLASGSAFYSWIATLILWRDCSLCNFFFYNLHLKTSNYDGILCNCWANSIVIALMYPMSMSNNAIHCVCWNICYMLGLQWIKSISIGSRMFNVPPMVFCELYSWF